MCTIMSRTYYLRRGPTEGISPKHCNTPSPRHSAKCITTDCKINFDLKKTPQHESASELYRPSDRRLTAKLVPTLGDRGVSRGQCDGLLRSYCWFSRPEPLLFLPSSSSIVLTRLSGPRSRHRPCN
jgi:hypothetical protein